MANALRNEGYAVDTANDGEEGLWLGQSGDYDAIILDIMLPKLDGLCVLERLRTGGHDTHVLLLTARDTVADKVKGLQAGSDDYLVKPFELEELLARVQALCRRSFGRKQSSLHVGDLEIHPLSREARRGGLVLELTQREYSLLEYLARRSGEIVTRGEIEAHIYDSRVDPMSNVVDSAICVLRRKLGAPSLIRTKRGAGYLMSGETELEAEQ